MIIVKSPPFAFEIEPFSVKRVAHLAGFEPALSSSQNWCFRGRTRIRSDEPALASIVMPWKAIDLIAGRREVHVWSRLPVKLQVHEGSRRGVVVVVW